ncbi:ABC transporter permease [Phytohabitans kaempferiae]|uniref:ABC transporter permease n=1 Tax=Phytohabitans kaempferiae TaxID=1620943 RepID=A0ABV6M6M0_9ACTN
MSAPKASQTRPARRQRRWWLHGAVFGAAALLLVTVLAPLLTPYDPLQTGAGTPLTGPSADHWLGTDQSGRDVFSRVIAGSRISFVVGIAATAVALVAGAVLGGLAAWARRWVGELIMRVLDVLMAFPGILLAVVLAAAFGSGTTTSVVIFAIIYTPPFARFVRAAATRELSEEYVTFARIIGSRAHRVLGYHVGANLLVPVAVFATTVLAEVVVAEAALSFIGVGTQPPTPSWGNVISDGRAFIGSGQWWISVSGGAAVFLTVLVFNSLAAHLGRRLEGDS